MAKRRSIPERWPYEQMFAVAGTFAVAMGVIAVIRWGRAPAWAQGAAIAVTVLMIGLGLYASWRRQRKLRTLIECDWRRCLYCFFDLRGLEDRGTCPECGEKYIVREVREAWKDLVGKEAEEEISERE